MITQQAQIKLNLPLPLKDHLESKATRFGVTLAGYIKHLILKDVENIDYPVYQISERTEKKIKQALKDKDKAVEVKDVHDYFKKL